MSAAILAVDSHLILADYFAKMLTKSRKFGVLLLPSLCARFMFCFTADDGYFGEHITTSLFL